MILRSIRRRSVGFSILFSLLLPVKTGLEVMACVSGPEGEELRFMLFSPDLAENKAWWTFFYNYKFTYLDGAVTSQADEREISREWVKELKQNIPVEEAYAFLYTALPDAQRGQNAFYRALQKNQLLLDYYTFANGEVGRVGLPEDVWEETSQDSLRKRAEMLIRQGRERYERAATPFLQKRYAYQLLKLAFYYGPDELFREMYHRHFILGEAPTQLDWWAAHYQSVKLEGVYPDSANYLHALVYAHADSKMLVSRQLFSAKNPERVMALAKNDRERADILVLKEAINPGRSLAGIKQIYALDSTHKHLPLLLIREINKLEDWLGTTQYVGQASDINPYLFETTSENTAMENWQSDFAYLSEFAASLQAMQTVARSHPQLYQLGMAYLRLMENKPESAKGFLSGIGTDSNRQAAFQATVLRLVLLTKEADITTDSVQEKMGQLWERLLKSREGVFESQKTLYSLSAYLKNRFAAKGLNHLAGLWDYYQQEEFCYTCRFNTFEYGLIRYFDESGSIKDVQNVLTLFSKQPKNTLEKQLLLPYSNPYYFKDLLSVKYLRSGEVAKAQAILASIPDSFWQSYSNANEWLDHDPFEVSGTQSMNTYTKKEMLQKVLELEREAAKMPSKRSHNYFLLGNFWLNLNGKTWFMVNYGKSVSRPNQWQEQEVNAWQKAQSYYTLALEYETNPEKKAQISYLMTECAAQSERKADYIQQALQYETYRNTQFYQNQNCLTTRRLAGN